MISKSAFASVLLAIPVGLTFTAQPASANTGNQTVSQTVKFRDLDLNQTGDAKVLLLRIRRAATTVCTGRPTLDHVAFSSRIARTCIKRASDDAVAKLAHPVVTAMYQGQPPPVQVAKN